MLELINATVEWAVGVRGLWGAHNHSEMNCERRGRGAVGIPAYLYITRQGKAPKTRHSDEPVLNGMRIFLT